MSSKLNLVIMILASTLLVTACVSSSSTGGNADSSNAANGPKFFKAVSGPGSEYFPLVGLRKYDNQITTYNFWRVCDGEADTTVRLYTGTNYQPIDHNILSGPNYRSGMGCKIDAKMSFNSGHLAIGGEFNSRAIDVAMQEISKAEFIQILQSQQTGFKSKYRALSSFDRDNYNSACKELFGISCEDAL